LAKPDLDLIFHKAECFVFLVVLGEVKTSRGKTCAGTVRVLSPVDEPGQGRTAALENRLSRFHRRQPLVLLNAFKPLDCLSIDLEGHVLPPH